ncbi:MAG: LemA family protein [Bacillota bacterium]
MPKGCLILAGVLVLIIALVGVSLIGAYNRLVSMNEAIDGQWAKVQVQLQRRFDLIPNLVETVKAYMAHESEVFTNIANARAALAGATTVEEQVAASNQVESALARLLVIVENYPQLKADTQFTGLRDELVGSENRIAVERSRFNEAVQTFNASIKRFPTFLYARMMGFEPREYLKAPEEAQQAPQVDFGK